MKYITNKWLLAGLAIIVVSAMSLSTFAGGGGPYVSCDTGSGTYIYCDEKVSFSNDCSVKVDCDSDEDDTISGTLHIRFGTTRNTPYTPSGLPCYSASYTFEEDGYAVCNGGMSVNLEDSPETKVVCENDTEFTWKVKCPHEEE